MASNDSGAAVAAAVNAVAPILPPSRAENKGQEATQANHNAAPSTTTTEANAASPVLSDPSSVSSKEVSKNDTSSVPVSSNTSTSTIPSSKATETNASSSASSQSVDTAASASQSKLTEDKAKNLSAADSTTVKPAIDTATSKISNLSENKKEESKKKENEESESIPEQEEKKIDQKTQVPSADGDKTKTDKTEQKAAKESPSSITNIDNKITTEKPNVSGSEAGKSGNAQDTTPTATVESPQAEVPSAKTKPPVPIPAVSKPVATIKPMVESPAASEDSATPMDTSTSKSNNKRPAEDGDDASSDKKIKSSSSASSSSGGQKEGNKTAKEVFEYMDKTFEQRRKIITKQMPTIPELKSMYPELFMCKQLLLEFQRITKIDIDQKIQEFCVRYATAVIEMARSNKAAAPVLARWEKAKQENETLKQYWDMVTALCLLPLHFGENFVEMVLEIEEDEEVKAQGKIVPTLVARGNIFRTDEFFLIAENTIVQEFEEFTIAFASLYSSYWVFNMVYPETIENTYNYIQRCIVRQREPGAISAVCKNFTKSLQKWNKDKEGK